MSGNTEQSVCLFVCPFASTFRLVLLGPRNTARTSASNSLLLLLRSGLACKLKKVEWNHSIPSMISVYHTEEKRRKKIHRGSLSARPRARSIPLSLTG